MRAATGTASIPLFLGATMSNHFSSACLKFPGDDAFANKNILCTALEVSDDVLGATGPAHYVRVTESGIDQVACPCLTPPTAGSR
jgi:hypothetical protein